MPSNLRAYVHWKDQTVFAGEEIECVITFKNIAPTAHDRERAAPYTNTRTRLDALQPIQEKQKDPVDSATWRPTTSPRLPSTNSLSNILQRPGHRQTLSLGVEPATPPTTANSTPARPKAHGRSLSILSIGASNGSPTALQRNGNPRRHSKAASLQLARGNSHGNLSLSAFDSATSPNLRQQSINGSPREGNSGFRHRSLPLEGALTAQTTTQSNDLPLPTPSSGFRFPDFHVQEEGEPAFDALGISQEHGRSRKASHVSPMSPSTPDQPEIQVTLSGKPQPPLQKEAPRSSGDIYTHSNVSDETVDSDLPPTPGKGINQRPSLLRQMARRKSARQADQPEHLMMGYVQTHGSFTVDGSLVNQMPFEEIKRKGVISSQGGGGVVGVERANRNSGLLGSFGWGSIGESITGILGMDDMSSMREMKNVASTKEIPLLSTPQSILFVNLHLAPGESRSYTYRFEVPRGLPPSHKGRAIKVSYHLRIAVQRAASTESKSVANVEVPFRLLGGVNRDGDILGHDLMSPYILLQDSAKTSVLPSTHEPAQYFSDNTGAKGRSSTNSLDSFMRYTHRLLTEQQAGQPLISPTTPGTQRRFSNDLFHPRTMKEKVDLAILRSNAPTAQGDEAGPSTNRFTIARSGQHVGILTIARPSYRLGETVHVKLDFRRPPNSPAFQHTYTVNASLETLENIDPSLALRAPASIARATRKIHATETQSVFFAQQVGIALEIPAQATPTFDTSGVQLQWRLKVELTTAAYVAPRREEEHEDLDDEAADEDGDDTTIAAKAETAQQEGLFELLSSDERGDVLVARERLPADSWDITVPLRVYGQPMGAGGVSDVLEI